MKYIKLPENEANAVLSYLVKQPYEQVAGLIAFFQNKQLLEDTPEPEDDTEE